MKRMYAVSGFFGPYSSLGVLQEQEGIQQQAYKAYNSVLDAIDAEVQLPLSTEKDLQDAAFAGNLRQITAIRNLTFTPGVHVSTAKHGAS
jgi:hypothetical protein